MRSRIAEERRKRREKRERRKKRNKMEVSMKKREGEKVRSGKA